MSPLADLEQASSATDPEALTTTTGSQDTCKMLTLAVWLGIYLRDEMSDHDVGILLSLDPTHVEILKHGIRSLLRTPVPMRFDRDLCYFHSATSTNEQEIICKIGDTPLGWHLPSCKMRTDFHAYIISRVVRRLPQIFREPSTYRDLKEEWETDESGHYTAIPHSFCRNLLVRLIHVCAEEMRKHKYLRDAATDPCPCYERTAAFPEGRDGFSKRPRIKKTRRQDSEHRSFHSPGDGQPAK
jgi:hypothetical protein